MNFKSVFLAAAATVLVASAAQAIDRSHQKGDPKGGVTVRCTVYNVLGKCMPRWCLRKPIDTYTCMRAS